jgi:hypothetical protein
MYQARKQIGVTWFSDYGGSAILTRALQILHREKGITLPNHSIFMNHPTSKSKEAISAAKAIGLTEFDKKSGFLNRKEFRGHFALNEDFGGKIKKTALYALSTAGATYGFTGFVGVAATGATLSFATLTAHSISLAGSLVFVAREINNAKKNNKPQKY